MAQGRGAAGDWTAATAAAATTSIPAGDDEPFAGFESAQAEEYHLHFTAALGAHYPNSGGTTARRTIVNILSCSATTKSTPGLRGGGPESKESASGPEEGPKDQAAATFVRRGGGPGDHQSGEQSKEQDQRGEEVTATAGDNHEYCRQPGTQCFEQKINASIAISGIVGEEQCV